MIVGDKSKTSESSFDKSSVVLTAAEQLSRAGIGGSCLSVLLLSVFFFSLSMAAVLLFAFAFEFELRQREGCGGRGKGRLGFGGMGDNIT